MIKIIRNEAEYEAAVSRLQELMALAPEPGTAEADQLEILGLLIEDYEQGLHPPAEFDAVDALRFRMEQLDLDQRALIPYIGSRSKVSEVLSRKRALTLPMIRALHDGLDIPIESLVRTGGPSVAPKSAASVSDSESFPWERFPILEMQRRGWLTGASNIGRRPSREAAAAVLQPFFANMGGLPGATAFYRRSEHVRGGREMDVYALEAWTARVMQRAMTVRPPAQFNAASLDDDHWLDYFVGLSRNDDGPLRAIEALKEIGITVIVEAHLPKTQLDGAAMLSTDGTPVIGLSIRHDRTDNFWFTLLHELAHIALHLRPTQPEPPGAPDSHSIEPSRYYDNLDVVGSDPQEREADAWSGEILVPADAWMASAAVYTPSPAAVAQLAASLGVADAIVAGKARHEFNNYRILSSLVGHGAVRRLFGRINWPD